MFIGKQTARCVAATFLFSVLTGWGTASVWADGVKDLGFEDACLHQADCAWTAIADASALEYADIVGSEGPGQFTVYDRENVEVKPFRGSTMLRLGLPQKGNEKAFRDTFAVEQKFTVTTDTLTVVLYFLSYEHRGDDTYAVRVTGAGAVNVQFKDESNNPFTLNMPDGSTVSCQGLPSSCELSVDTGKSNSFLNSGWKKLKIIGLTIGEEVTLRYELTNGQNNATGSWLYADNSNEPPVAAFTCAPTNVNQEGDLTFCDARTSKDPDGDALTYSWDYSGAGYDTARTAEGAIFAAIFAKDGIASIGLTVSDGVLFDSIGPIPITISNHKPVVGAVDIEAQPGDTVTAVCRFLDYGTFDQHTVEFNIGTLGGYGIVNEENDPALSTGTATFEFAVDELGGPDLYGGSCTVGDGLAFTTATFDVNILQRSDAEWAALEALDARPTEGTLTWQTAVDAAGNRKGVSRVVRIDEPTETFDEDLGDAFRLLRSDGQPLQGGDEVLLRLSEPANGKDLDLVLLLQYPAGFADLPAQDLPAQDLAWKTAPAQDLPAQDLPAQDLPAQDLPAQDLPAQDLTLLSSLYNSLPAQDLAFSDLSFLVSPAQDLGFSFTSSPIAALTLDYYQYPLRDVATYDFNVASNVHLGFSETGGLNLDIDPTVVVPVALSANAEGDDSIWYPIPDGIKNVFALVVPSTPAGLAEPAITAILSYEASERPPAADRLPEELCFVEQVANPPNVAGPIQPLTSYGWSPGSGATAVFLQKERMMATWFAKAADPEQAFNDFMGVLDLNYFRHAKVQAEVYSLPLSLWHALEPAGKDGFENVCDLEARLDLIEGIRQQILDVIRQGTTDQPRPGLQHVVLLGDYDSMDPGIARDLAVVGNERNYRFDANLKVNSPLSVIIADGYLTTDNCYVDFQRQVVSGEPYCTPDLPVARWSGIPAVIEQEAITFNDLNGILPSATALGMGYDFFAQSTADALAAAKIDQAECITDQNLANCENVLWDGQRVRDELLGQCDGCDVHDFNIINGHAAHWALVPPAEFFSPVSDFSTILRASELKDLLDGKVLISLGCHFRLSVPATQIETQGGLFDAREDFCDQAGPIVGESAFGIGDTEFSNKLTELIMQLTVGHLADGLTLGQAVRASIVDYGLLNVPFTEHDAHVAMAWGIDGPPQYRFAGREKQLIQQLLGVPQPSAGTCAGDGTLALQIVESDEVATSVTNFPSIGIERCNVADRGEYWTYDGNSQGSQFLPELPVVLPVEGRVVAGPASDNPIPGETHIHSATLLSGTFFDYVETPDALDPVFDANITDWSRRGLEAQPCIEALVPVQPGVVKSLDTAGQTLQNVAFIGGAFTCTEKVLVGGREQTRGIMRIFDSASMKLQHPSASGAYVIDVSERDTDFFSPVFKTLEFRRDATSGEVIVDVLAKDASGIDEYRVLIFHSQSSGGAGSVTQVSTRDPLRPTPLIGEQQLVLPDPSAAEALGFDVRYGVIAVDGAGNFATKFKKGAKFVAPIPVSVISRFFNLGSATTIEVIVSGYDQLIQPIVLKVFINDVFVELTTLDPDVLGEELKCVQGKFGSMSDPCTQIVYTTSVELSNFDPLFVPPITVRVEVQDAASAFGFDEVTLFSCIDEDSSPVPPAGDFRACQASINGTVVTVDLITAGGTDSDYQYRWVFNGLPGSPQFKIWNIGGRGKTKTTSPTGVKPVFEVDGSVLRLRFDGAALGVQPGVLPDFTGLIQSGVQQEPGQGFLDEISPSTP